MAWSSTDQDAARGRDGSYALRLLIGAVLILATFGFVMLASASSVSAAHRFGDPYYFVKRQAIWLILAFAAALITARVPVNYLRRWALPAWGVSLFLLLAVWFPVIGHEVNGSHRWIKVGAVTFQPSEAAKLGSILLIAWWMSPRWRKGSEIRKGFLMPLACLGLTGVLILFEPDFGTTMLVLFSGLLLMYAAGAHVGYIIIVGLLGMSALSILIMHNPERMGRILAFLNPGEYVRSDAWQLVNSLCAFTEGGLCGVGLGESIQKRFYLPEAHTDFIFAIMAEELGLIASGAVLLLFVVFFLCGIRVATAAGDR